MMKTIDIRGMIIGEGVPKIIVPIVEVEEEGILRLAEEANQSLADLVEWRVDFFSQAHDTEKVLSILSKIRKRIQDKVLIFTFRTKREGGEKEISPEQYIELNRAVAQSGLADLVDVEMFSETGLGRMCTEAVHRAGALVIGSNHDFHGTPSKEELVFRLRTMQENGADIPKIAVMAKTPKDILTLLEATWEMCSQYADRPLITMAMSGLGSVSRISGEIFGSCATFGTIGRCSAPGQVSIEDLTKAMNVLHRAVQ